MDDWFTESDGTQLFVWRARPHRDRLLMAGNRAGYLRVVGALAKLGKGHQRVELALRRPGLAPPLLWAPSAKGRRAVLPIEEIERELRKTVQPFAGFLWFRHLELARQDDTDEPRIRIRGDGIRLGVPRPHLGDLSALFESSTFPMFGGCRIATGEEAGPDLWLSADWLGAE